MGERNGNEAIVGKRLCGVVVAEIIATETMRDDHQWQIGALHGAVANTPNNKWAVD